MVNQRESIADFRRAFRAHDPRDLEPVVEEDQCRPECDPEGAAERAAAAILDLQMPDAGVVLESLRDQRLGSAAIAAPGRAEFDDRRPVERVDVGARRRGKCKFSGHRHQFFLLGMQLQPFYSATTRRARRRFFARTFRLYVRYKPRTAQSQSARSGCPQPATTADAASS